MQQLLLTIIFYALMVGIFVFVFLMWRTGVRERQKLTRALIEVSEKNAEANRKLADLLELQNHAH